MKRTLLTLLLGLGVGLGTHFAYFQFHQPPATDTLEGQLAWMRTELHLTDAQFARVKAVHQASSPHLRHLATQLAGLHDEFRAFEQARRTADRVDFLEFARFVELRRHVRRASQDSTRQLVLATAEVMTPPQRERYLQLVDVTESSGRALAN